MDARVSVEEARLIITRFNNKGSGSNRANRNNYDNKPDTKLRMWYPCETMKQDAMRVMEKGKGVIAVTKENEVEALENKMSTYEPVITPSTRNDWAQEEHCSLWSVVNGRVSVQEPRSIITGFNNKESISDGANQNTYNKKPDTKLRLWYPCETMQKDVMDKGKGVIAMTEENKVEALENNMSTHQPVIAPSARNYWTQEEHWSLWYAMNARVGVEEPGSIITGFNNKESSPIDGNNSKYNNKPDTELRMQYHCESMQQEGTRVMEESNDVIAMSEDNNVEVLENEMSIRQPVIVPSARIYWTKEEHWNFLHGLSVYGRGKWKEISKDFVSTKTPVQVSSHAHKYFKRLQRKNLRRRYSINDLGLEMAEPLIMENSSSARQSRILGDVNNRNPSFGL
ncbi:Myb-like protein J [Triticum urartu]|uniref:Myb-like protein J n=2 Tax=Triticum urartu TaxID=4572 RepID=M7YFI3_TRIUA|nr:Myb-like protein J [Triticum urartu]